MFYFLGRNLHNDQEFWNINIFLSFQNIIIFNFAKKMYNQSTLFSSFTNGNMGLFYPHSSLLVQ